MNQPTDQNQADLDDPTNWVVGNITLSVNDVPLEMKLTVPKIPVQLRKMLPIFQQMTNAFVDLAVQRAQSTGDRVSCQVGCAACCRHLVPISKLEAEALRTLVNSLPEPRRQEIQDRFSKAKEKLNASGVLQLLRNPDDFTDEAISELSPSYFRLDIPCPFLEDESCTIHADRPLACREHLVTSPAANCAQPTADNIKAVPIPLKLSTAVTRLSPQGQSRFIPYVPLILSLDRAEQPSDEIPTQTGTEILTNVLNRLSENPKS